jgi:hypothetical protein
LKFAFASDAADMLCSWLYGSSSAILAPIWSCCMDQQKAELNWQQIPSVELHVAILLIG